MMVKFSEAVIKSLEVHDVRFPTSLELHGSDAMVSYHTFVTFLCKRIYLVKGKLLSLYCHCFLFFINYFPN